MIDYSFLQSCCSLIMLVVATVVLCQLWSLAGMLCALSLSFGALACLLIPTHNTIVVDDWAHTPGLSLLLIDLCLVVSSSLQFAFVSTQSSAWSWKRAVALMVAGGLAPLLPFLWVGARQAIGRDAGVTRLFYQGYYAHPLSLLAWNTIAELVFMYADGLALFAYVRLVNRVKTRPGRLWVGFGILIGCAVMAHGALVLVQIAVSGLGYGASSTGVMSITLVMLMVAGVCAVVLTAYFIVAYPTWRYIWERIDVAHRKRELLQLQRAMLALAAINGQFDDALDDIVTPIEEAMSLWQSVWYWISLPRQREELKWLQQGMLDTAVLLTDQWRYLRHYADLRVIKTGVGLCHDHDLSDYQCDSVAEVAACWVMSTISMRQKSWYETNDVAILKGYRQVVGDEPQQVRAMREFYFWSDVAHVVMIVVAQGQWHAPERWHYLAAVQITRALNECQAPINRVG